MRLRLTLFGIRTIVFFAMVTLAYFASPSTNLFFLLFAFLSVLFALNVPWTLRNVRGLAGRIETIPPFAAGAIEECEIVLESCQRTALHVDAAVRIRGQRRRHVLTVEHVVDRQGRLRGRLPRLPRGIHDVVGFELSSSYPLGVLRASRALQGQRQLVVYPEPLAGSLLDHASSGSVAGQELELAHASAPTGAADCDTAALRAYRDGDSIRRVHWRASARNPRDLVVRELEPRADRAIHVRLDARCAEPTFERALSALARLALHARDLEQPICVHTQDFDGDFGAGRRPLNELWELLAKATPRPLDDPAAPAANRSPAGVELPAQLDRLARRAAAGSTS